MRVLIIQTAFIGDVVLTTPLICAIEKKWPSSEIHFVSTPQGCEILKDLGSVHFHIFDKHRKSFRESLSDVLNSLQGVGEFDEVFCVHRSFRSLWLGKKVTAKRRWAFRSVLSNILGYQTVQYPPYDENLHYVDKPMKLLASMADEDLPTPRPKLGINSRDQLEVQKKIEATQYIVMSPFSVWGTKMWFADRFARVGGQLSKEFRIPVILIGTAGPKEVVTSQTIAEKIESFGGTVKNLVGQTTLGELKAVIANGKILITNDSAPVHIASAFDVPTVAIFGPTVKKWGFFPLSTKSFVVERLDVPCRPCHIHGPEICPKKHFRCMDQIQVEDVVNAVKKCF